MITGESTAEPGIARGPTLSRRELVKRLGFGAGASLLASACAPLDRLTRIVGIPQPPTPTAVPKESVNPKRVIIESSAANSSVRSALNTPAPTTPRPEAGQINRQKEENRWTNKTWSANEAVPLSEWWADMVAKGHIRIDDLAKQYAGQKIDELVDSSNLIPNPVKYYEKQIAFTGNCKKSLDELVQRGQGHIRIDQEAYKQIPGADQCDIYSKK